MLTNARFQTDGSEAHGIGQALVAAAINDTYEAPDHHVLNDDEFRFGSHDRGTFERDRGYLIQVPTGWHIVIDSDAAGWLVAYYDDRGAAEVDYEEWRDEYEYHATS